MLNMSDPVSVPDPIWEDQDANPDPARWNRAGRIRIHNTGYCRETF